MNGDLDLGQLRSFVSIADHGGFGRAAAALHLSQPAVSQHVRGLERRLRQTLVERQGRAMRFTADGERLLTEARHLLAVHDEALARLVQPVLRPLEVGVAASLVDAYPALLAALRGAVADRPTQLLVDRSSRVRAAVEGGESDAAVFVTDGCRAPGIRVGRLPLRWVSSPTLSLAHDAVPFVGYTAPCGLRSRAASLLDEEGRAIRVEAESQSLDGVVATARAGLGVTLLPVPHEPPSGLVARGDLPGAGFVDVRLVVRDGLEVETESAVLGALERLIPSAGVMDRHHESSLDRRAVVGLAS